MVNLKIYRRFQVWAQICQNELLLERITSVMYVETM